MTHYHRAKVVKKAEKTKKSAVFFKCTTSFRVFLGRGEKAIPKMMVRMAANSHSLVCFSCYCVIFLV